MIGQSGRWLIVMWHFAWSKTQYDIYLVVCQRDCRERHKCCVVWPGNEKPGLYILQHSIIEEQEGSVHSIPLFAAFYHLQCVCQCSSPMKADNVRDWFHANLTNVDSEWYWVDMFQLFCKKRPVRNNYPVRHMCRIQSLGARLILCGQQKKIKHVHFHEAC